MNTLTKNTEFTDITEFIYKKESVSKHENTIKMSCHPERSEGSVYCFQILRDAQNDILIGDFYFDTPSQKHSLHSVNSVFFLSINPSFSL